MTGIDIVQLARELAARMAPDALLDSSDVGALLKCSARQVTERYALVAGFPAALRLTGMDGAKGQPRYRRSAIMKWIASHENGASKRGGRPREN